MRWRGGEWMVLGRPEGPGLNPFGATSTPRTSLRLLSLRPVLKPLAGVNFVVTLSPWLICERPSVTPASFSRDTPSPGGPKRTQKTAQVRSEEDAVAWYNAQRASSRSAGQLFTPQHPEARDPASWW